MAIAAALYVLMLVNALSPPSGSGEARISDAYAAFFLTVGLWIVLAIMLFVGSIMGAMPRWAAGLAVLLVPLSGVAAFAAIDMCSRNMQGAIIFPVALPLIIAFYAYWARSPQLHDTMPAKHISTLVWGAVFFLSVIALTSAT